MTNLEKVNAALLKDPETVKKLAEEISRISESRKTASLKEVMGEAVRNVFGFELTEEELEKALAKPEKMSDDELDLVAGGFDWDEFYKKADKVAFFADRGLTAIGTIVHSAATGMWSPLGVVGELYRNGKKYFAETDEMYEEVFGDDDD